MRHIDREEDKRTKNNSFFSKNNKEWMDNRIEKELAHSQRDRSSKMRLNNNKEWYDDDHVIIPDILVENRLELCQL